MLDMSYIEFFGLVAYGYMSIIGESLSSMSSSINKLGGKHREKHRYLKMRLERDGLFSVTLDYISYLLHSILRLQVF